MGVGGRLQLFRRTTWCVKIVMIEKLDCILSKRATRPIYMRVQVRLNAISPYQSLTVISGHTRHLRLRPYKTSPSPAIRDSSPAETCICNMMFGLRSQKTWMTQRRWIPPLLMGWMNRQPLLYKYIDKWLSRGVLYSTFSFSTRQTVLDGRLDGYSVGMLVRSRHRTVELCG
jgi:hypothetical protein